MSAMSWYMNEINLSASKFSKKTQINIVKPNIIPLGSQDKGLTFYQLNKVAESLRQLLSHFSFPLQSILIFPILQISGETRIDLFLILLDEN